MALADGGRADWPALRGLARVALGEWEQRAQREQRAQAQVRPVLRVGNKHRAQRARPVLRVGNKREQRARQARPVLRVGNKHRCAVLPWS